MSLKLTSARILVALGALSGLLLAVQVYAGGRMWEFVHGVAERACGCSLSAASPWWQQPGMFVVMGIVALGVVGMLYALVTGARGLYTTRRMTKIFQQSLVKAPHVAPHIITLVHELGLRDKIDFVSHVPGGALTYGFWKPRIMVSASTMAQCTEDECKAILQHEMRHLTSHDPLRLMMVSTLERLWFWMPLVRVVGEWYRTSIEVAADQESDAAALVGALYKLHTEPSTPLVQGVASFGACLRTRIAHIAHPEVSWEVPFPWQRVAATLGIVGILGISMVPVFAPPTSQGVAYVQCRGQKPPTPCVRTPVYQGHV